MKFICAEAFGLEIRQSESASPALSRRQAGRSEVARSEVHAQHHFHHAMRRPPRTAAALSGKSGVESRQSRSQSTNGMKT
ncbi:MAG: hypothetical protein ACKPKO_12650, partial [Candidatus Fonsibacter sp.]